MISINREPANDVAERLTGRRYLSHSAVSTYQSCPLKYYFRYVAGIPEETVSAALVFGGAIHLAAETHYRSILQGESVPSSDDLFGCYQSAWSDFDGREIQYARNSGREQLDNLARRMLEAFVSSDVAQPKGRIIGIEEELTGSLLPGVPDVLARIDLLVETEDAVVLTDVKTARSRWSSDQVKASASQLLLYQELVRPLANGKPLRLEFAVLTKTKSPDVVRYVVPSDSHRIERTKQVVQRVWHGIQSEFFYPAPSPLQCPSCPYQAECEAWNG